MTDPLRRALRDLGDVPPPADLASGALARARRDRRRTVVALAVVAAVVAAVAVTVPTVLLRRGPTEPATPAPAVWVSSYRLLSGPTSRPEEDYVYDAASRGYRPVPDQVVVTSTSPDGSRAVVTRRDGARMAVVPLDRLAGGLTEADWSRRLPPGTWRWSPDGTRLLSLDDHRRPSQVEVFDLRTGTVTRVPLRWDPRPAEYQLSWGPGGRGFALWPGGQVAGDPMLRDLTLFDETGQPTRRYPLPGPVRVLELSPDGTRALLVTVDARTNDQAGLLDLATGSITAILVGPEQWYDDRHLLRVDRRVSGPSSFAVFNPDSKQVVRRASPGIDGSAWLHDLTLARSATAPPGAIVL